MFSRIRIVILGLLLSTSAFAGFHVEPYLGYGVSGKFEDASTGGTIEADFGGVYMGGRLGYGMLGLSAGLDYSMRSFELEYTAPASIDGQKEDQKQTNMGIFVAYEFPVMIRAWFTYHFKAEMEDDDGSDIGDTLSGKGQTIGVGWTGLPFVSINLEYRKINYDELEDVSAGTTSTNEDYDTTEIALSVSLPLDL